MRRLTQAAALLLLPTLLACASEEEKVQRKVEQELSQCQAAEGTTWDIKFETGPAYTIYREFCAAPVWNIKFSEKINATADAGPYTYQLRQNTSDGRWLLTGVAWTELDRARSIDTLDDPADSDLENAERFLAAAEAEAPNIDEIKLLRLKFLLLQRKRTNKKNEADKSTLGVAEAYYKQATEATASSDPDLALALHLQVLAYYDRFRQLAEESATPSAQTGEWQAAAVKAVRIEAEDAKKAGNMELYKKKLAEAEEREKENAADAVQREEDAKVMGELAKKLKARQCEVLSAARAVNATDSSLKNQLASFDPGC